MDVDELDLALVHALQTAPRAPWSAVGQVIGLDAGAAARRWRRLVDERLVWATVMPSVESAHDAPIGAAVEVECAAVDLERVGGQLAEVPWILTVEQVSNRSSLLLEVVGLETTALARRAQAEIGRVDGVARVMVYPVAELFGEGGAWRLDAISPAQRARLLQISPSSGARRRPTPSSLAAITQCLRDDVRMPIATLARTCGWSESTARRKLDQVLGTGALRLRVDLAQPATGFPLTFTSWWRVPTDQITSAGTAASQLRSTRLCASLATGHANLVTGSWVRDLAGMRNVESELTTRLPEATLLDRALTVRSFKRGGCLLDHHGRTRGVVHIEL
ncbi:MAG: Lrp/AsnC family transcriptional regulator [Aeromicrobium sp.]|uniref:Lrp/AsnC family transcriptional regulator n=1 Tax=Aeromicrobium sp. TaxID=1871063 RepID=UPI0025BE8AEA|nr:Lrp/AsnC family transcriptional regulator [Aeromicrobium sp.]MCK5890538.1 Lrp/AsnC family transcriptional regulator [Aeromicrobium sp.]MDF1703493.1 Lrp/AsnC family transcriptional regulator [Aeromicrobium sp.]